MDGKHHFSIFGIKSVDIERDKEGNYVANYRNAGESGQPGAVQYRAVFRPDGTTASVVKVLG